MGVMDQGQCDGAIKTNKIGGYWDTCGAGEQMFETAAIRINYTLHGCKCKSNWKYHGMKVEGCTITPDAPDPWCIVEKREDCLALGAERSASIPGEVWDTCHLGEKTDHACHCSSSWDYGGLRHSGCDRTFDHVEPWCYVTDGKVCAGAIKTHKDGKYWDTCVETWNSTAHVASIIKHGTSGVQKLHGWGSDSF